MGRPSFGRSNAKRGLDQFDTPATALDPLFAQEPLLAGVTAVCEPFCGKGNLVVSMRARGLIVHASDIVARGCPDSSVLDFLKMTRRPPGCSTLLSNPPYAIAMAVIEHALALGFRAIILLLKSDFFCTIERHERLHKLGHLRRIHVLDGRLQEMHDAKHLAAGGDKKGQPFTHCWYVIDRNHRGPAKINPVSLRKPFERMPWARSDNGKNRYHGPRGTSRSYVLARLARAGRLDLAAQVEAGALSVRAALSAARATSAGSADGGAAP
jgi:hypothetical protein